MKKLNFPEYDFRIRENERKPEIFDAFRKKYVALTPEEWVRQNLLMYLVNEKRYPASLIAVEAGLKLYNRTKRTDIVVYNNKGNPLLIAECKAPEVVINQKAFDQIARYNMALKVNYMIVTNGLNHYCCFIDYQNNTIKYLKDIPDYKNLLTDVK